MEDLIDKINTLSLSDCDKIHQLIIDKDDSNYVLLKNKSVIQWIYGDLSFLSTDEKDKKKLKILEDEWGRQILKTRRPDLKLDKQWTNKFGEHLCEELYYLINNQVTKPVKKIIINQIMKINIILSKLKHKLFSPMEQQVKKY